MGFVKGLGFGVDGTGMGFRVKGSDFDVKSLGLVGCLGFWVEDF